MQEIEVAGTVRAMTERTRFIDQALERAVADGASQCLILGAGFDSRAYRFTGLLARARECMRWTGRRPRRSSRRRVAAALGDTPANLTYVAADLQARNPVRGAGAAWLRSLAPHVHR